MTGRGRGARPRWAFGMAAAAAVVTAIPALASRLSLVSDGRLASEPWRWWTGHLVHGSAYHLLWDGIAWVVLGVLFERTLGRRLVGLLAVAAPIVGLGTLAAHPELSSYGGLSGLLNAVWVAGSWFAARDEAAAGRTGLAWAFRACVVADAVKIAIEIATGRPMFVDPASLAGVPVPVAHALGAVSGAAFVIAWGAVDRRRARRLAPAT